jgi:hypothetical protein
MSNSCVYNKSAQILFDFREADDNGNPVLQDPLFSKNPISIQDYNVAQIADGQYSLTVTYKVWYRSRWSDPSTGYPLYIIPGYWLATTTTTFTFGDSNQ